MLAAIAMRLAERIATAYEAGRNKTPKEHGCNDGRSCPLPGFARADNRREFMPSELASDVVRASVANPIYDEAES